MQIDPTMLTTELPALITTGGMAVAIIEWMKNSKVVPFMNAHTATMNRVVGWIAAFCGATGLHYKFDHTAGILTITGISAAVIGHTIYDTVQNYAFQWLVYKGVVKPATAAVSVAQTLANVAPVAPVVTPIVAATSAEKKEAETLKP